MNKQHLLKFANYLRSIPRRNFDMGEDLDFVGKRKYDEFKRNPRQHVAGPIDYLRLCFPRTDERILDDRASFFGICKQDEFDLFPNADLTPKQLAQLLEDYVMGKSYFMTQSEFESFMERLSL